MNIKTQAVVLNKVKYNDNSYIVNLFTNELGKIAVFVRIPKSRKSIIKPAMFFPLNIVDLEIGYKNSRSIQSLKDCTSAVSVFNICTDINRISIAQFISEIVVKTTRENQSDESLFKFLFNLVIYMEKKNNQCSNLHLLFMKEYARILGFEITNNYSEDTPYFSIREGMFLSVFKTEEESMDKESSSSLSDLLCLSIDNINSFKIEYNVRKEILLKILMYYSCHLDGFSGVNCYSVLNSVFTD